MCIKLHFNFPLVYILCIAPMHTMCIHASWNTEGVLVVGATDALAPAHLPGPSPTSPTHSSPTGSGAVAAAAAGMTTTCDKW